MSKGAPLLIVLALAGCNSTPTAPGAAQSDAGLSAEQLGKLDGKDPKQLLAVVDQMAAQLKDKPKTFEVLVALGNLYYENSRYLDAVDVYRQALAKSAPVEAEALALQERKVKPAAELPAECRRSGPSYGLEQIAEVARKLAATEPAKALRCDDEALGLAVAARARRGNALYLVGNPDQALAEHQKVLAKDPDYPESLFFVGAILLEKSRSQPELREQGKAMWRKLLAVAPEHPRAALVKENLPKVDQLFAPVANKAELPPGHPSTAAQTNQAPGAEPQGHSTNDPVHEQGGPSAEQVKNLAEAAQNTERTPALEKSLDESLARGEALLDEGKYAEARSSLIQVMPMRPDDPRVAAAMGGVMRGLGKLPMAERVLGRALQLDPKSARANYELGMVLAAKGDKAGAAERFQTAQAADAAFAARHKIADELARIR